MRDVHFIETRFWVDPGVQALSVKARLTALYLMTGPDTRGPEGFRCPKSRVAEALQMTLAQVEEAFAALTALGFFTFDEQTDRYVVHRFLRQRPRPGRGLSMTLTPQENNDGTL